MAKKEPTLNQVFDFTKRQFGLLNDQLVILAKELKDVKVTVQEMGKDIKMLKEDVDALGKSIYKHHIMLENHRKRIHTLEEER